MSHERTGWGTRFWERLATGPKMLLILTLGLLPLGVVAIFTSIHSARENNAERARQTLARLDDKAERLNELLARTAGTMRAANAAVTASPPNSRICDVALRRLGTLQAVPGRYALYRTDGEPRCASTGFTLSTAHIADPGSDLAITADGQSLRLVLYDDFGRIEGVAEFSRAALRDLTFIPGTSADFDLELLGGGRQMLLRNDYRAVPFARTLSDVAPIGDEGFQLRIRLGSAPVRAVDVLLILLPVLMWLAAALMGWVIVNRLLLLPLARIQRVVSLYKPGDRPLDLRSFRSPAREIGELGQAFDQVTRTVARHEADLEVAVERQKRLVREVHHRVKNNLQVVASLLNLHSRGSPNEEVAAAYASIQRRVDALAVVHRNHYAELEENRGVALKPLVSELAANLRATAPAQAAGMQIRLDVAPLHSTQDAGVSVAFLITEIVEYGMLCGAGSVSIVLEAEEPGSARLSVEADSLAGDTECDPALGERFERIVIGLARQLRSALDRDPDRGRYSVRIAVIERTEE